MKGTQLHADCKTRLTYVVIIVYGESSRGRPTFLRLLRNKTIPSTVDLYLTMGKFDEGDLTRRKTTSCVVVEYIFTCKIEPLRIKLVYQLH